MSEVVFNHSPEVQKLLKNYVCAVPFRHGEIYPEGNVNLCCHSWLPNYSGNVNKDSLFNILNNSRSRKIRDSVQDGTYRYCDIKTCPELNNLFAQGNSYNLIPKESPALSDIIDNPDKNLTIYLSYDRSCNLHCPSCRNEKILFNAKSMPPSLQETHDNTVTGLRQLLDQGYTLRMNITGSGDPFASPLYTSFLNSIKRSDKIVLMFQTNGILMRMDRFTPAMIEKTQYINLSVDAATESTYKVVRRGGSLATVHANVTALDEAVLDGRFSSPFGWQLNFVVQNTNFREIPEFVSWVLAFKSRPRVWFNLIADWGHLDFSTFSSLAVWRPDHPRHEEFLNVLIDDALLHPRVLLGNLAPYVVKARASRGLSMKLETSHWSD